MTKNAVASTEAKMKKKGAAGVQSPATPEHDVTSGKTVIIKRKQAITKDQLGKKNASGSKDSASATLTPAQLAKLKKNEEVIERGFQSFYEMGRAFAAIRDEKLFAPAHDSFEDYLEHRWDITRQRGSQIVRAYECHKKLSGAVEDASLPATERAMREVLRTPDDRRVEVITLASKNGTPTTTAIIAARDKIVGPIGTNKKAKKDVVFTIDGALDALKNVTRFLKGLDPEELGKGDRTKLTKAYAKLATRFTKLNLTA
jgi:hypothetical protein